MPKPTDNMSAAVRMACGNCCSPDCLVRPRVERAIKAGEIKLEPTVMPDTTNIFKGSKAQRNRPARIAEIEAKMADMPKKIAEYKAARLEKRRAAKRDAYFK